MLGRCCNEYIEFLFKRRLCIQTNEIEFILKLFVCGYIELIIRDKDRYAIHLWRFDYYELHFEETAEKANS